MAISKQQPLRPYVQALGDAVDSGDIFSVVSVQAFDTVADMQAATYLDAGMTCHTNGFHTAGDDGAAYYAIGTTGNANGMDVLSLQGGLFATLVVTEPYVTPEQFGAYGDGTHDDTAALQKAITTGSVQMSGQYAVSSTVNAFGNIVGDTGCLVTAIDKSTRTMSAFFNHAGDLHIEGVTFNCLCNVAYASSDYQTFYNVAISSINTNYKLNIDGCTFNNVYTSAINLYGCAGDIIINGCIFNPSTGNATVAEYIRLTSSSFNSVFVVKNCVFIGTFNSVSNYCGIYLATLENRKAIVIEDNILDGLGRKGTHRLGAIDCYDLVNNIKVKNNQITNCAWNAMRLHTCSNSDVSGNYITMDASRERLSEWCIIVSNNPAAGEQRDFDGIAIRDNVITCIGSYQQQVAIQIVTASATRKISGCVIANNEISGTFIDGLQIDSIVSDAIVVGNTVRGGVQNCIQLPESDYTNSIITIKGNVLSGRQAIYHRNTGGGLIEIVSNIMSASTGFCVNATGAPAIIIDNSMSGVNGSSGGKLVGLNNLHDLSGDYQIINATTMYANYNDGSLIS